MEFGLSVKLNGLPKFGNPFKKTVAKGAYPVPATTTESGTYRDFFYTIEDGKFVFSTTQPDGTVKAYKECPPIAYIMTRKALAFNNGIWSLHSTIKKEGDPITNMGDPLWKLFNNPNPLYTGKQFRAQSNTIAEMCGVCWWLKVFPSGFDNSTPSELWILPPQYLKIKWKDKKYLGATKIQDLIESVTFNDSPIDKEMLYPYVDITTGLEPTPIPQGRMCSLAVPVLNLCELWENKRHVIVNRGAQGILTNTSKNEMGAPVPLDKKDEERLQKDYNGKYGLSGKQWKLIITALPLQYQNMSYSPAELLIEEYTESELRTVCNGLGYPFPLLGEGSETTFNNTEEASKMLYQNFEIPAAQNFTEQFNDCCNASASAKEFVVSYDHLEVLQGDKEKEANISAKEFDTAYRKFKASSISYGRFVELIGEKEGYKAWLNKYWPEFSADERQLFESVNQKKGVNNDK